MAKKKRGRPLALTPEKRAQVLAGIAKGMSMRGAADLVLVSYTTIKRTKASDPEFRAQLKQAKCQKEFLCLDLIEKAGATTWQAAAWWLERVMYGRYAKRDPDTVTQGQIIAIMAALATKIRDAFPASQHANLNEVVTEVLGTAGISPKKKSKE